MGPVIESSYPLPDLERNEWPVYLAAGCAQGGETVVVGSYTRLLRLDLGTSSWETFPVDGVAGAITGVTVTGGGGCYLGDRNRIHRLNERMAIVSSTPRLKKAGVKQIVAAEDGLVALLSWRGKVLSPSRITDRLHVLVRYSGALEKRWHIVLPGELNPVIPLVARGEERFYIAASLERLSLIEIRGHLESFRVHDIPELRRRLHATAWPFDDVYDPADDGDEKRIDLTTDVWDACSHCADDAVTLAEWVVARGELATRLYYCRFDEQ